jgi:hypothetical protein
MDWSGKTSECSTGNMNLEDQLRSFGLPHLASMLDAELTIESCKGTYAIFWPKQCLRVAGDKLILAHPCESGGLSFSRDDILRISSGVSVVPYSGPGRRHSLFQRVIDEPRLTP